MKIIAFLITSALVSLMVFASPPSERTPVVWQVIPAYNDCSWMTAFAGDEWRESFLRDARGRLMCHRYRDASDAIHTVTYDPESGERLSHTAR